MLKKDNVFKNLRSYEQLTDLCGKEYWCIKKMVKRRGIKRIWLTKKEALNQGLPWRKGGGGGKNGKRPFIDITDPAIPYEVITQYVGQ